MGHREDLLAGARQCLYEKGYARTTARDIVAASGTNLGSIGYHYGSTEALLNAALMDAVGQWGAEMERALAIEVDPGASAAARFENYWTRVIDSFDTHRHMWAATFDVFGQSEHAPELRKAIADGLQDGRLAWASLLQDIDPTHDTNKAQAVGSFYQALLSGVLVQWLIDPQRAPSAADLTDALRTITSTICDEVRS